MRRALLLLALLPGLASAAHPYWRVRGQAQDTSGSVSISELSMAATEGGADQCSGGAAVYSNQHGALPASAAFDNDTGTFWFANGAAGAEEWLGYHFATSVDVVEVTIDSRHDGYYAQSPRTVYVDYSDDGSTWTNSFAAVLPIPWIGSYVAPQKIHAGGTKRRWRINASSTVNAGDNLAIEAVEFRASVGGSNAATGGYPLGDSVASNVAQYLPGTAFDGNASTFWIPSPGNAGFPHYIGYDLPAETEILEVSIKAPGWQNAPKAFSVDYSTDNGMTWTTSWSVADSGISTDWPSGGPRAFANPAPPSTSRPQVLILTQR